MPQTEADLHRAQEIGSSEGGPKQAEADALRHQTHNANKMENKLEMRKENKQETNSADEVAGRKEKGSIPGLLQKVTGDSGSKWK